MISTALTTIWAGEAVDLIHGLESAAVLVKRLGREAEALLQSGARLMSE